MLQMKLIYPRLLPVDRDWETSQNLYKLKYSPFKNIGRNKSTLARKVKRSGFKNFR